MIAPKYGENLLKNGYHSPLDKCCENCAWCYHGYEGERTCEHPANHEAKLLCDCDDPDCRYADEHGRQYDPLDEDTHDNNASVWGGGLCNLWSKTRNNER